MLFQSLLIMLVAYTGIYVGVMLGLNSPEEMKPGKRYLNILRLIIYAILVALPLIYLALEAVNGRHYGLAIVSVALALIEIMDKQKFASYTLLGILLALFIGTAYFFPVACLVFLYGFPLGSLLVEPDTNNKQILKPWHSFFRDAWHTSWGYIVILVGLVGFFIFLP